MIKIFTVYTHELDNSKKAVQDILNQIDMKNNLLKNSVALLFCHAKFIDMGIMQAVCGSLPFDVLGCTSMYFALPDQMGEIMLTLTILTSDDTEFAAGVCEPLTPENVEAHIHALYQKTAASFDRSPELVFAFQPTMLNLTGDVINAALDRSCGGIPIFGTAALDFGVHIRSPKTLYNGNAYNDRMAILLFRGPVKPRFFSIRFPEKSILAQDAVITGAEGSRLISINNEPAASFLKEMGLMQDGDDDFTQAIPLVIDCNDGTNPEVVIVQYIDPEGALICSRRVSVGGVLDIGAITRDYVLESAGTLIHDIQKNESVEGFFIVSCFLRGVVLGEGSIAEVKLIQQELGNAAVPWSYISSGGELCPMYTESGKTVNQAFQYALIACQF